MVIAIRQVEVEVVVAVAVVVITWVLRKGFEVVVIGVVLRAASSGETQFGVVSVVGWFAVDALMVEEEGIEVFVEVVFVEIALLGIEVIEVAVMVVIAV